MPMMSNKNSIPAQSDEYPRPMDSIHESSRLDDNPNNFVTLTDENPDLVKNVSNITGSKNSIMK